MIRAAVFAAIAGLGAATAALAAPCSVREQASVPLAWTDVGPVITATVNGVPADFVLDSGAARSVVDEAAVARLNLKLDEWAALTMHGAGGYVRHRVADLRSLAVGGAPLSRHSIAHDMSVAVVPSLPFAVPGRTIAGLLGGDYLASHDWVLDPASSTAKLYDVSGCAGRFIPWQGPYDQLQAVRPNVEWLVVPVTLDGHGLQALLDTGAAITVLTPRGARAIGWSGTLSEDPSALSLRGVGPGSASARLASVPLMVVGSEHLANVPVVVGAISPMASIDLLLGGDWSRSRRIWLSYATTQVFVSRP